MIALRDGALGRALDELDPMERAVLLAVEVDELSEREVARELGVSPWKVHDRLQSAKEKLRRAA
ncbi:MAG: sigma-70 family RNA polymerase sigma factor [Polyangiales bacterium]